MNRIIAWFATNHVAANLLMGFAVIAGLAALTQIPVKLYPDVEIPIINVSIAYPGAAPEEVASGVCARIEERVQGITGVKEVRSVAVEGRCTASLELFFDVDDARVLDEVKNQVNAIDSFPDETEKPVVNFIEQKTIVLEVAVTGPTDERALKELGFRVRDDIVALPGITHAVVANVRPYEISVEISQTSLIRNRLTLDDVATALRQRSIDLPGGTIDTGRDQILLRTRGQAYWGHELEKLVVTTRTDGTRVLIRDIAHVVDGFEDSSQRLVFDGKPAALVQVARVGNQDLRQVSESVREFVKQSATRYPEGVELTLWNDESVLVTNRIGALVDSGIQGLLLVLILLTLFLRPQLALWVAAGIPIAFLGAIFLIYSFGFSIDAISVIGFILALGMLVDDAVVVGESVHVAHQRGLGQLVGAIEGAQHVLFPVTFGVLTTAVAFIPLLFSVGPVGEIMAITAATVIFCLIFSLIECQMVLPAHLGHAGARMPMGGFGMTLLVTLVIAVIAISPNVRTAFALALATGALVYAAHLNGMLGKLGKRFARLQLRFESGLESFLDHRFRDFVRKALNARLLTLAIAFIALASAVGILVGGHLPFTFMLPIQGDQIAARVTMPHGVAGEVTEEAVTKLAESAGIVSRQLADDNGTTPVVHIMEAVGGHPSSQGVAQGSSQNSGTHLGEVVLQLTPSDSRDLSTAEISQIWRDTNGPINQALELNFETERVEAAADIDIRLSGDDLDTLGEVAGSIRAALASYPGVFDVTDSFRAGSRELQLAVTPAGEALGVTLSDLGRQVRRAFYGEETQRVQRGREDVRIMVRLTEDERHSLDSLFKLHIRTSAGVTVPLRTVANVYEGRGFASVSRANGKPYVSVTASVDPTQLSAAAVLADLSDGALADAVAKHPSVAYTLKSEERTSEVAARLGPLFLLAMFVIFALLAIPLRSYFQPLIIMSMLPFAFMGAVWGHVIMKAFGNIPGLSMPSVFGMVAAAGVVVNASLVLMHEVNHRLTAGDPMQEALINASVSRARPILITTVTTLAGLLPLMLSRSVQAQPLIPMAASLAYGVLFASLATLFVAPAIWLVVHDLSGGAKRMGGLLGNLVGGAPRLSIWAERFPYVQESLRAREFKDLQLSDDLGLDEETARIAREGLVRVYYQREFDREKADVQLKVLAAKAPTTDNLVEETRIWAEQQAFQLAVHMLQGVMTPLEASVPLSDILDACLATMLHAAERDLQTEPGERPDGQFALIALESAGRREFAIGQKINLLFVYDPIDSVSSDLQQVAEDWYGELMQRFMRLLRNLSPEAMLFEVPSSAAPDSTNMPYKTHRGGVQQACCSLPDLRAYLAAEAAPSELRMLCHARAIDVRGGLEEQFEVLWKSTFSHSHDRGDLVDDILDSRTEIASQHQPDELWDVHRRAGGLTDVEHVFEYLLLSSAETTPELLNSAGLISVFETAAESGLIDRSDAEDLKTAAQIWQCLDGYFRLTCIGAFTMESMSADLREIVAQTCGATSFESLPNRLEEIAGRVNDCLDRLLDLSS